MSGSDYSKQALLKELDESMQEYRERHMGALENDKEHSPNFMWKTLGRVAAIRDMQRVLRSRFGYTPY